MKKIVNILIKIINQSSTYLCGIRQRLWTNISIWGCELKRGPGFWSQITVGAKVIECTQRMNYRGCAKLLSIEWSVRSYRLS